MGAWWEANVGLENGILVSDIGGKERTTGRGEVIKVCLMLEMGYGHDCVWIACVVGFLSISIGLLSE